MNGESASRFARTVCLKSPVSVVTVMVLGGLLSATLRNESAFASEGCPAPSFAAIREFRAPGCTVSVAVGDFNGDGKPDMVVASCNGATVFLNTCSSGGIKLAIALTNNTLVLSWPLPYTNVVLESTTNLGLAGWESTANTLATNGSKCEVKVPLEQEQRYFRLRKP